MKAQQSLVWLQKAQMLPELPLPYPQPSTVELDIRSFRVLQASTITTANTLNPANKQPRTWAWSWVLWLPFWLLLVLLDLLSINIRKMQLEILLLKADKNLPMTLTMSTKITINYQLINLSLEREQTIKSFTLDRKWFLSNIILSLSVINMWL